MKVRISLAAMATVATVLLMHAQLRAQDIPGIEICTVEKTMERRTSCLQSNVEFLQKTLNKVTSDYQQKLNAARVQIDALKAEAAALHKSFDELQAGQNKMAEDIKKKADAPPTKDAAPAAAAK
jgi:seryl-tRNA synthetase